VLSEDEVPGGSQQFQRRSSQKTTAKKTVSPVLPEQPLSAVMSVYREEKPRKPQSTSVEDDDKTRSTVKDKKNAKDSSATPAKEDPFAARRLQEREDVDATNPGGGVMKDEKWYVLDASWLRLWRRFTKAGSSDPPPGPITNHRLLLKDGRPAPGLRPEQHYRGVNVKAWTYLHDIYGGGPPICCPRLDIYTFVTKDTNKTDEIGSKEAKPSPGELPKFGKKRLK